MFEYDIDLNQSFVHLLKCMLPLGKSTSEAVREDVMACVSRDPTCLTLLEAILFFKGFAALVLYRVALIQWKQPLSNPNSNSNSTATTRFVSLWLQSQASSAFVVDIHPGATIGSAVMLDHGTGTVIGETACLGHGCTLLNGVTLDEIGKATGDRHSKIGNHVLIGANVPVLGNIWVRENAKIEAGGIVLSPIPLEVTAKIIGRLEREEQARELYEFGYKGGWADYHDRWWTRWNRGTDEES